MRVNKFFASRIAVALALSICVNAISYADDNKARLVSTTVNLSEEFSQKPIPAAGTPSRNSGSKASGGPKIITR